MSLAEQGEGGERKRETEGVRKREKNKRRQAKPGKRRTSIQVDSVRAGRSTSAILSHAEHPFTLHVSIGSAAWFFLGSEM